MRKLFVLLPVLIVGGAYAEQEQSFRDLYVKNSLGELKKYILKTNQNNFTGKAYSIDEIYSDYANNELSANQKYKDKNIRIKTTAGQIKEDVFGNAYIIAKIKDSLFGSAQFWVNEKDPRILSLSKGNNIDLMCKFDEYSLDSLTFKNCIFTDQFADNLISAIYSNLLNAGSDNYKPQSKLELILSSLFYKHSSENINAVCKNDPKNCNDDSISKSKFYKKTDNNPQIDFESYPKTISDKYGKEWFDSLPKIPDAMSK